MSTDRTDAQARLMGFLVPDETLELWEDESTYTEADPQVGAVLADRSTQLQLSMSGTPTAGTTLELLAQQGGLPDDSAQCLHRESGGAWLGHDPPIILSGAQYIAAGPDFERTTIVATRTGVCLVGETANTDGTPETTSGLVAHTMAADDSWTSAGTVLSRVVDGSDAAAFFPSLVRLPNDVLELYYINQTLGDFAQLGKLQSFNGGATWERGGDALLAEPIDLATDTITGLRVAASGGQHLALIEFNNNEIRQYGSSSAGARFVRVVDAALVTVGSTAHLSDLKFAAGYFVALYWERTILGAVKLHALQMSDAFTPGTLGAANLVYERTVARWTYTIVNNIGDTYTVSGDYHLSDGKRVGWSTNFTGGVDLGVTASNAESALTTALGAAAVVSNSGSPDYIIAVALTTPQSHAWNLAGSSSGSGTVTPSAVAQSQDLIASASAAQAALVSDETDRLWVYFPEIDATGTALNSWRWLAKSSTDAGRTWSAETRWYGGTAGSDLGPSGITATWFRGRALLAHLGQGSDLWSMSLGGWSSLTSPPTGLDTSNPMKRSTAFSTWHAMTGTQPDDNGDWTKSTSGSPSDTTTGGVMSVTGGAGETIGWEYAPGLPGRWAWGRAIFDPSGSGVMRLRVEVRPSGPAAPVSYGVTAVVDCDAGTLTMTDTASGSTLGSAVSLPAGMTEVWVGVSVNPLGSVSTEKGSCWYRDVSGGNESRTYTEVATDQDLTDNGGTTSTHPEVELTFNTPATAAFDVDMVRLEANTGGAESLGGQVADPGLGRGMAQDDLFARGLSTRSVYLADGQSVQAMGVARRGDSWIATPTKTYDAANVLPTVLPTPKRGWRSNAAPTLQRLAFKRSEVDIPSRGLLGVYCDGQNSRGIQVELHSGGSWSSVLSVLPPQYEYNSFGEAIIPNHAALSGDAEWFDEDELAGCTFEFADGTIRRIRGNRAGAWGPADQVTPILYLEGITGTEPTGTGTGRIWFPRTLILLYLPDGFEWKGIRTTFDTTSFDDTVDGDMRADVLAIGEVMVFGAGPDETRALVREIGPELVELPNGDRSETERRDDAMRVELSWARPIPLKNRLDGSFDFVRADENGPPVGDMFDAPTLLDGLVKRVGRKLMVYIPDIPVNGGSGALPSNPDSNRFFGLSSGAIYGRIVNQSLRLESSRGHANRCEAVRTNVITFVEEGR